MRGACLVDEQAVPVQERWCRVSVPSEIDQFTLPQLTSLTGGVGAPVVDIQRLTCWSPMPPEIATDVRFGSGSGHPNSVRAPVPNHLAVAVLLEVDGRASKSFVTVSAPLE